MLEVDIDKILPVTEARDSFNQIVDEVAGTNEMYVLTKNGKPAAVIVGVNHLEKLTGKPTDELAAMATKTNEMPVVEETQNTTAPLPQPPKPETATAEIPPSPAEPITQPTAPVSSPPEPVTPGQPVAPLNTSPNTTPETPTENPPEQQQPDDLFV